LGTLMTECTYSVKREHQAKRGKGLYGNLDAYFDNLV